MNKKPSILSPQYIAGHDSSELDGPIYFSLELDRWYDIPTKEYEYMCNRGGMLENMVLIPGKNIQADLLYPGEIKCIDMEMDRENPLFHSENMKRVEPGHYRFTTRYMPTKVPEIPSPQKARKLTGGVKDWRVIEDFLGEAEAEDLILTLQKIHDKVDESANGPDDDEGWEDFKAIFDEYKSTGRFSGRCKSISTFTAGLIEALGLRSRSISGNTIHLTTILTGPRGEKITENRINYEGHMWSEAYIPINENTGYWIPVDPAIHTFLVFPDEDPFYILGGIELPSFKDQSVETAKLRLRYV